MSENKALWKRAFVTDPKAVKPITGKQYSGNSPKPYWIVERLTDEFGPCGIGWGFTILSERFERFSDTDTLHVAVVRLWYVLDGKRGEFEQVGQTKGSYKSSAGKFIVDEDAPKKSVTDALVKCASYLGFAGDIFSGMWDDSKYVAEANREWREREAIENATPEELSAQKRTAELEELALYMIESHHAGKDMDAIRVWYDPASFNADNAVANDERTQLWGMLKAESKLRAAIKANKPAANEEGKAAA